MIDQGPSTRWPATPEYLPTIATKAPALTTVPQIPQLLVLFCPSAVSTCAAATAKTPR
jgi:hypothetical protein